MIDLLSHVLGAIVGFGLVSAITYYVDTPNRQHRRAVHKIYAGPELPRDTPSDNGVEEAR